MHARTSKFKKIPVFSYFFLRFERKSNFLFGLNTEIFKEIL